MLGDLARDAGWPAWPRRSPDRVLGHPRGKIPSQWVAMARTRAELGRMRATGAGTMPHGRAPGVERHYSSPISVLKLG